MTSFLEIVRLGIHAKNNNERKESEGQLLKMRKNHPNEFFKECGKNFNDDGLDDMTRKTISIIMNKSLKEKENGEPIWYSLRPDLKESLKNASLHLLLNKKKYVARAAAQAISIMFNWEFRNGNWTEILEKMIEQSDNSQEDIKTSAITALGFICEELSNSGVKMEESLSDRILTGICRGLQGKSTPEIKNIALHALRNAISFIYIVLKNTDYRDFLMDLLIKLIIGTEEQWIENSILSFQCVLEISKWYYTEFGTYMRHLADISEKALASNSEDLITIVTEMWNEFASFELTHVRKMRKEKKDVDISKSFVQKYQNQIVPKIMLNLCKINLSDHDDDDTSKNVYSSSMRALKNINELLQDSLETMNMQFMEKFIESEKAVERIAALAIYGCLTMGSSSIKVAKTFNNSAKNLMKMLMSDETLEVRIAVIKLFITVGTFYPQLLLQNSFLSQNLVDITKCCNGPVRLSKKVYLLFEKLVEKSSSRDLQNSIFTQNIRDITSQVVSSIVGRSNFKDASFIDDGFRCVLSLIERTFSFADLLFFLPQFLEGVVKSTDANQTVKTQLLEGFMISVQMSLWKIHKNQYNMDKSRLITMYNTIRDVIKKTGVTNEAVLTVATIGINLGHDFQEISGEVFEIFMHAKQQLQNFEIVKVILESASMLCRDMRPFDPQDMEKKMFRLLIDAFKEKNFPTEYRGMLFITLGDFALNYFDIFLRNMKTLHDIYRQAFDAVLHFLKKDDPQFIEYGESLRACLIDSYICVMHSFHEHSQKLNSEEINDLKYFMKDKVKFIDITTKKEYNPTLEYALNCLTLLCDVVMVNEGEFKELLRIQVTKYLVEILSKYRDDNSEVDSIITFYNRLVEKTRN